MPKRFCLVTSAHLCNNPRLVKEADALSEAGHSVRVVAPWQAPALVERDRQLLRGRNWDFDAIDARWGSVRGFCRRAGSGVVQRLALRGWRDGRSLAAVQDRTVSRYLGPLTRLAAAVPADVFIAHNLPALPAAARAAARHGADLGFDAEDFHTGELPDGPEHAAARYRLEQVEGTYLRRCRYVTAASDGIAGALAALYGIQRPLVVLNVFPGGSEGAGGVRIPDRRSSAPSLYWFSQVIGEDRGIEDALDALPLLAVPAHLHLRGEVTPDYRRALVARSRSLGCEGRLHILPTVPPEELIPRAIDHDIGLALERRHTRNRDLCVTNKVFVYMAAGLAIAATDTVGQRGVLSTSDAGAFLYPGGDSAALAAGINELLMSADALQRAKAAALRAASAEFAWVRQAASLVSYLGAEGQALKSGARWAQKGVA